MYPKGTVYVHTTDDTSGEKKLHAPLLVKILYRFIQLVAAGITAGLILFVSMFYWPIVSSEVGYNLGIKDEYEYFDELTAVNASKTQLVQELSASYGVDPYFSIVVPKIGAKSNIVANVDITNEESYMAALQNGVAHASGTYFPGQGKSIYLFSHSTDSPLNISRFNAVFYLLRKLEPNDIVIIFFADKMYEYKVSEKHVVEADDVHWLSKDFGLEKLLMQTCDPPGTSLRRMIIVADLIRVIGTIDPASSAG